MKQQLLTLFLIPSRDLSYYEAFFSRTQRIKAAPRFGWSFLRASAPILFIMACHVAFTLRSLYFYTQTTSHDATGLNGLIWADFLHFMYSHPVVYLYFTTLSLSALYFYYGVYLRRDTAVYNVLRTLLFNTQTVIIAPTYNGL